MSALEAPILLDLDGPLARITLNRPAVLNAMNLAWVQALEAVVERVAAAPEVRVVVIRGAGRACCSGLDLDMYAAEGMPAGFYEGQERAFAALERLDAITIAAIHGYCLGGGLQLALACDLRVCASDARLGLPAINEGLVPAVSPHRLPRIVGLGVAFRLVISGEVIDAEEALRLRLVEYLLPAEQFEAGLADLLDIYVRAPRTAAMGSKRLLRRAFDTTLDDAIQETGPLIAACLASPEAAAAQLAWRRRKAERASDAST